MDGDGKPYTLHLGEYIEIARARIGDAWARVEAARVVAAAGQPTPQRDLFEEFAA